MIRRMFRASVAELPCAADSRAMQKEPSNKLKLSCRQIGGGAVTTKVSEKTARHLCLGPKGPGAGPSTNALAQLSSVPSLSGVEPDGAGRLSTISQGGQNLPRPEGNNAVLLRIPRSILDEKSHEVSL